MRTSLPCLLKCSAVIVRMLLKKPSTVPVIVRVLIGSEIRRQPFTGLTLTGSPPVLSFDMVVVGSGGGPTRPSVLP
jgi:hypothetical protein